MRFDFQISMKSNGDGLNMSTSHVVDANIKIEYVVEEKVTSPGFPKIPKSALEDM